jgi:hypothetical protein
MSNIGAVVTISRYSEFKRGAQVAYKLFRRREDLADLIPQECHVKKEEFEAGHYPKFVKVSMNGDSLVLPVKPHLLLPPKHVRVCTPEPVTDEDWCCLKCKRRFRQDADEPDWSEYCPKCRDEREK